METSFLPKTLKRGARTGMQVRMILFSVSLVFHALFHFISLIFFLLEEEGEVAKTYSDVQFYISPHN